MSATYMLAQADFVLTDGVVENLWLHDIPRDPEELHIAALAASGDYFVTLAAKLEEIACALPADHIEQYRLQHLIGQLLYLQRHYTITKK